MILSKRLFNLCLAATLAFVLVVSAAAQSAEDALGISYYADEDWSGLWAHRLEFIERYPDSIWLPFIIDSLGDLRYDATDPRREIRVFQGLAADPRTSGMQRQVALEVLVERLLASGRIDEARVAVGKQGTIRSWLAIGPFGFAADECHRQVFQPELDVSARPMKGVLGDVDWRLVPQHEFAHDVDPIVAIDDHGEGCVYALAQVSVVAEGDYALTLSSEGSFKVWVNGGLVAERDRNAARSPAYRTAAVHLAPGFNHVLVKLSGANRRDWNASRFHCRLTTLAGERIDGVEIAATNEIHPAPRFQKALSQAPKVTAERLIDSTLERGEEATMSERLIASWILETTERQPEGFRLLAPLAERGTTLERYLYGLAVERYAGLPEDQRTDMARRLYTELESAEPNCQVLQTALARLEIDSDKAEVAVKRIRKLRDAGKTNDALFETSLRAFRALRWLGEWNRVRAEWYATNPDSPRVRYAAREWYATMGNDAKVKELVERDFEVTGNKRELVEWKYRNAYQNHQLDEMEMFAKELDALDPDFTNRRNRHFEMAHERRFARAAGKESGDAAEVSAEDERLIAEWSKRSPHADEPHEAAERFYLLRGQKDRARPHQEVLIARNPEDERLRKLLGRDGDHAALFAEFDPDGKALIDEVQGLLDSEYKGKSSIYVLDHETTIVERDGSVHDDIRQIIRLNDKNAVERHGTMNVAGEVLHFRIVLPDGTIVEPSGSRQFTLPGLVPGALIDVRYRRTTSIVGQKEPVVGSFYFQDRESENGAPYHLSQWIVFMPKNSTIPVDASRFDGEHVQEERGDRTLHVFRKRRVQEIRSEPYMPGDVSKLIAHVNVGTRTTDWPSLSQHLYEQSRTSTEPTPLIAEWVDAVVAGVEGDAARVRAIYDRVLEEIRTEDGGAWPEATLVGKSGNRSTLLAAALRHLGIPYSYAMVMSDDGDGAPIEWDRLDAGSFDAPLLKVSPRDSDVRWIFPHLRRLPFGEYPREYADRFVWITSPEGGALERLPSSGSCSDLDLDQDLVMDAKGARVEGVMTYHSVMGASAKEGIEKMNAETRRNVANQIVSGVYRGLSPKIESFEFENVDSSKEPFRIRYAARLGDLATRRSGVLSLRPLLPPMQFSAAFVAGKSERKYPLVLPALQSGKLTCRVALREGMNISYMPKSVMIPSRFGVYRLDYLFTADGRLLIERAFERGESRVEPRDYAEFVKFCRQVDDSEGDQIRLDEGERQGAR